MKRTFDEELKKMNIELLKMATMVEEAIFKSIEALKNKDKEMAQSVIDNENKIDELELVIEERCINLLALRQPLARDLRFITTGMKINIELERIADLAANIAQRAIELANKPLLKPLEDISKLTDLARKLVKDSVDAFVNRDQNLAKQIILSKPEAYRLRHSVYKELIKKYMVKDGKTIPRAIRLLLVTRYLERICGHATNVAEDIIYMVQAKVVKHHIEKLDEDNED